jgi:hypothetical protein
VQDAIKKMPDDLYDTVSSSSANLTALYKDIKSGLYDKVMPEVMKLQSLYGKTEPTLDTYLKVVDKIAKENTSTPEAKEVKHVEEAKRNDQRKRVAASPKGKKESFIAKDIANLGEDEFEAQFAKIMGRSISDYK